MICPARGLAEKVGGRTADLENQLWTQQNDRQYSLPLLTGHARFMRCGKQRADLEAQLQPGLW